jgi:hypothetical protein
MYDLAKLPLLEVCQCYNILPLQLAVDIYLHVFVVDCRGNSSQVLLRTPSMKTLLCVQLMENAAVSCF